LAKLAKEPAIKASASEMAPEEPVRFTLYLGELHDE